MSNKHLIPTIPPGFAISGDDDQKTITGTMRIKRADSMERIVTQSGVWIAIIVSFGIAMGDSLYLLALGVFIALILLFKWFGKMAGNKSFRVVVTPETIKFPGYDLHREQWGGFVEATGRQEDHIQVGCIVDQSQYGTEFWFKVNHNPHMVINWLNYAIDSVPAAYAIQQAADQKRALEREERF